MWRREWCGRASAIGEACHAWRAGPEGVQRLLCKAQRKLRIQGQRTRKPSLEEEPPAERGMPARGEASLSWTSSRTPRADSAGRPVFGGKRVSRDRSEAACTYQPDFRTASAGKERNRGGEEPVEWEPEEEEKKIVEPHQLIELGEGFGPPFRRKAEKKLGVEMEDLLEHARLMLFERKTG